MEANLSCVCQVPLYIAAQCSGAFTASFLLRWILHPAASEGATLPAGSDFQSFLIEIVITFILMFVIAAVATDTRAVRSIKSDSYHNSHNMIFLQTSEFLCISVES